MRTSPDQHAPARRWRTIDRRVARWPTTAIAVLVGGFVVVVFASWTWSHVIQGDRIDDVAVIIIAATVLRSMTVGVSIAAVFAPPVAPRLINAGLAACGAAQLVYPAAELAVKTMVLTGVVESGASGVRNVTATGWFNFGAAALVFGVPGVLFVIQAIQHGRRHHVARRWRVTGSAAGLAGLVALGAVIGSGS